MKTFKEFLNERVSQTKQSEQKKVSSASNLRTMILNGEDISDIDYSSITNMQGMFEGGIYNIEKMPQLDTSNVSNMSYMFSGCLTLKEVPHLDTSNVTDMRGIFDACDSIETIERPSDWYLYDWNSSNAPKHLKSKYPELYNKELR